MLRQVSARCQRGKGNSNYKLKNGLQIALIVAFCLWLLNQMEHSHDKRCSSRKDLGNAAAQVEGREEMEPENVGHEIVHKRVSEDDEGENGAVDHEMDGEEAAPDRKKKNRSKRVGALDDGGADHEEASHEAREISFKGDDASSEVGAAHAVQEANQEKGLQEAGEWSFAFATGHDTSRAHASQVNEPDLGYGGGAQGDKDLEKGESRDRTAELPHNLDGNGLRTHNTNQSEIQKEKQPGFTRTANAAIDINPIDKLQTNSINFAVPQNKTAATDSMDGQIHRVLKLENTRVETSLSIEVV